ncbi:MAG TPA: YtxH domain-containing protein [Bacteroidota bacterium]|nr:YtxH domain-containing protein [Bacteroidota bacterium]
MGTVKLMIGALAAGAMMGILFAPAKGSITRRRIAHQAGAYADDIRDTFEDFVETMTHRIDSVRGDVMHLRKQLMG